jgi:hypothetical protein
MLIKRQRLVDGTNKVNVILMFRLNWIEKKFAIVVNILVQMFVKYQITISA